MADICRTQIVRSAIEDPASDKRIGLVIPKSAIKKAIILEQGISNCVILNTIGPHSPWKLANPNPYQKLSPGVLATRCIKYAGNETSGL